ncbi:MAG: phytoene/squalene synthase family protein [Verrucomicrobiota bacterium]
MGSLNQSHRYCQALARDRAKSFFFSSYTLPRPKRHAAYAIYAFCREADDLVDEAEGDARHGLDESLGALSEELNAIWKGEGKAAYAPALGRAVEEFGLSKKPFEELLTGVGLDVESSVRIQNWDELYHYCYHVASVVGLMMAPVLGLKDPAGEEQAIALGLGMQLTNILRDIREDYDRNRIYLPATEMEAHGVSEDILRKREVTPEFERLLQFQIERARSYYESSEKGIALLANDGSRQTAWMMRLIYSDILNRIESRDYDVFSSRVFTPLPAKLRLAFMARRRSRGPVSR